MVQSFGRAFSPIISGRLQVTSGFDLPFIGTIIMYVVSIAMYYVFFLKKKKEPASAPSS